MSLFGGGWLLATTSPRHFTVLGVLLAAAGGVLPADVVELSLTSTCKAGGVASGQHGGIRRPRMCQRTFETAGHYLQRPKS